MRAYLKLVHNQSENIMQKQKPPTKRKRRKRLKFHRYKEDFTAPRIKDPVKESETDLCKSLWQSVIIQGLYDIAAEDDSMERRLERAEAIAWFGQGIGKTEPTDFEIVCDLASMDTKFVQRLAKKVKEEGFNVLEGFNFRTMRKETSTRKRKEI